MELVVATRIEYLAEEYSLLSGNYFGGIKKKSTFDTLVTLQEKFYQAWQDEKILSLVTFDVKVAFNDVASEVPSLPLFQNLVSEQLVFWIEEFLRNQKALVVVNGIITEV